MDVLQVLFKSILKHEYPSIFYYCYLDIIFLYSFCSIYSEFAVAFTFVIVVKEFHVIYIFILIFFSNLIDVLLFLITTPQHIVYSLPFATVLFFRDLQLQPSLPLKPHLSIWLYLPPSFIYLLCIETSCKYYRY